MSGRAGISWSSLPPSLGVIVGKGENCEGVAGFVPSGDRPEHLRTAVVAIAYSQNQTIHADDVIVEGLYAGYWGETE